MRALAQPRLMFGGLLLLTVLVLSPPVRSAAAQEVPPAELAAIRQVIENQLAAFRRDDAAAAFAFASPAIQDRFGTAGNFMEMVRSGYRPVYRPRETAFREARMVGPGRAQQAVLFVGPDGEAVVAIYSLEQQADGAWRIGGVYFVKLDESTA